MFSNKHILAALLIAPVLAVIAYVAADRAVSERPAPAAPGASYKLAEQSDCRYESGRCTLRNGDIVLELAARDLGAGGIELTATAAIPLDGITLALVSGPEQHPSPVTMQASTPERTHWHLVLPAPTAADSRILLAAGARGSYYYGEISTAFTVYRTSYHKDFRRQAVP
jgi:hypothetical protein